MTTSAYPLTAEVVPNLLSVHAGQWGYVDAILTEGVVLFFESPADGFQLFEWEEITEEDRTRLRAISAEEVSRLNRASTTDLLGRISVRHLLASRTSENQK